MPAAENPEEIDLGDDMDEEEGEAEEAAGGDLKQKAVPAAVFGALADKAAAVMEGGEEQQEEHLGALERFKKRKVDQ
jgi:hypothetical protein